MVNKYYVVLRIYICLIGECGATRHWGMFGKT